MAVQKWMLAVLYFLGFLSFGYLSTLEFLKGKGNFGYLMALCSLLCAFQIIHFLYESKKERWNNKRIIADRRILNNITLSFAVSYIYILLFLLIGIIGYRLEWNTVYPIDFIVMGVVTSLLLFMLLQIVQRFFK